MFQSTSLSALWLGLGPTLQIILIGGLAALVILALLCLCICCCKKSNEGGQKEVSSTLPTQSIPNIHSVPHSTINTYVFTYLFEYFFFCAQISQFFFQMIM